MHFFSSRIAVLSSCLNKAQGLQEGQPVTLLSGGGDTVRELPMGLHPQSEHLLDEYRKLLKAVRAFETYVTNHRAFIPNYGERYRQRETISTGFMESAVNQVVSKRFVKKQQMRWTPTGPTCYCKSESKC